jgi:hypothetical protein
LHLYYRTDLTSVIIMTNSGKFVETTAVKENLGTTKHREKYMTMTILLEPDKINGAI